jgi:REP element-mobilizing transposase RayT
MPQRSDRVETTSFWWGRLPHWEVVDGRYFVTIRLAGALPEAGSRRVRELSAQYGDAVRNGQDGLRLRRAVFREMELWLHTSSQVTHLVQPAVAGLVTEAIRHRQEQGVWEVFAYVLMPNHIHLFVRVLQGSLRATMESFKSWTGGAAASMLGLQAGRFWQREWFDHWSRSGSEDEKISQYVRANPVKAGLVRTSAEWPHGSWPASPPAGGHPR